MMLYELLGLLAFVALLITYYVYRKAHHYGSAKFEHDFPDAKSEESKPEDKPE